MSRNMVKSPPSVQPAARSIEPCSAIECGKQMQQRHAEHQPADKAHDELHPAVRQLHQPRQHPAGQRRQRHQQAIDDQNGVDLHLTNIVNTSNCVE